MEISTPLSRPFHATKVDQVPGANGWNLAEEACPGQSAQFLEGDKCQAELQAKKVTAA